MDWDRDGVEFKAWVQVLAEDMPKYEAQKLIHNAEFDHLWSSHDEQVIGRILKCHTLIEYYLTEYLKASNPSLGSLETIRLSFDQKLRLTHSEKYDLLAIVRPGLTELNRIRNRIAHRLSPKLDTADLKGMRQLIEALEKAANPTAPLVPDGVELIEAFTRIGCSTIGLFTVEIREVAPEAGLLGWQRARSERLDQARRKVAQSHSA